MEIQAEPAPNARDRAWVFTLNNYTDKNIDKLESLGYRYLIYGKEVAPSTGTPHLQGFIYFENARSFKALKTVLPWRIVPRYKTSTNEQAIEYCKKENNWVEYGTPPKQGAREDIKDARTAVFEDKMSIREIAQFASFQGLKHAEALQRYIDPPMRTDQEIIWRFGDPGVGKTRWVYDNYAQHEIWKWNSSKWFDGYDGHKVVLLDDYRPDILPISTLLNLLDIYPLRVEVKGGFRPLLSKIIIITAVTSPEETFINPGEPVEQLLRRINKIVWVRSNCSDTEVGGR